MVNDPLDAIRAALPAHYQVERVLGVGGMASVYLAHDVRHDRLVAIKVLAPELGVAIGAERFLQEIKVTASLQHPHILPLFESGTAGGLLYYVMPYVEGESLRGRLARETQLSVDEAVRIVSEIADALEYAHGKGVVHRDIKPENVMLRDGHALVADFGVALAVSGMEDARITRTGLMVGTPSYMAPEQAMAERQIDRRADIYALGCILYEMLAGEPPHAGPTMQSVVARVLSEEPRPLRSLRKTIPPHVDAAIFKALRKVPADRFSSARAFRDALRGSVEEQGWTGAARAPRSRRKQAALVLGAAAVLLAVWWTTDRLRDRSGRASPQQTASAQRLLDLVLPDTAPLSFTGSAWDEGTALALSNDGRRLVYVAEMPDTSRLVLRDLDGAQFRALRGTEGGYHPFFSPDGTSVAFFANGQLLRVSLDDGLVVALADVQVPVGGAWPTRETNVVADGSGLVEVDAASGKRTPTAARCTEPARPCWLPNPLPDNEWVLVSSYGDIALVSRRSGERRVLADSLFEPQARLLPSGDIAYFHRPGQLFVLPFDTRTRQATGAPVPVLDDVRHGASGGQYAVSDAGTLVFATGGHLIAGRFVAVTRDGVETVLPFSAESHGVFNLSPDGLALVSTVYRTTPQLWLHDLVRGTARPLVTNVAAEHPVWSPDGSRIAFVQESRTSTTPAIMVASASGGRLDTLVANGGYPFAWTRDGFLSFVRTSQDSSGNTIVVAKIGDATTGRTIAADGAADAASLSPDGKFIAYMSAANDRWEVHVQPYPVTGERWVVSQGDGGLFPRWSADGEELFFMRDKALYAVDMRGGPAAAGPPRRLFEGEYVLSFGHAFAVSPDAERFYLLKASDPRRGTGTLRIIDGWMTAATTRARSQPVAQRQDP